MCKCNSGKMIKRDNSFNARRANMRVQAVYSNYTLQGAVKVYSGFDASNPSGEFLGTLTHGKVVSVPSGIVGALRSDGSTFVLPNEFVPSEMTEQDFAVIEQRMSKPRKRRVLVPIEE